MTKVAKSVPNSVANSASNSVPVNTRPQLGPHQAPTGNTIIPVVPKTEVEGEHAPQPHFRSYGGSASVSKSWEGAPSVPVDGFLFKARPIDEHYRSEFQPKGNPYATVGRPGTFGWWTRIQTFINGIATSQNKDNAGWNVRTPQQRTSIMLNALPPKGAFGTQTFEPHPQPQAVNFNRIVPTIGTDPYGSGRPSSIGGYQPGRVLNSDTFGAGQTAAGQGGNQYTPTPGPPDTTSTSGDTGTSSMPTWG